MAGKNIVVHRERKQGMMALKKIKMRE